MGLTHENDLTFEQLRERFEDQLATAWDFTVAELDGEIVGLLALKIAENQIDQLFVSPEHKGQGIGKILLDHAKAQFPGGAWLSSAEKNYAAIEFYKRAGFVYVRTKPRPEYGRNDVIYEWRPD